MTITTPPQETRTRRRAPAEQHDHRDDRDDEVKGGATGATRTTQTTKTAAKTKRRTPTPTERRTRRPAPKRASGKQGKSTKTSTATKTGAAATTTSGKRVKVTVVRRAAAPPRAPFVLLVVGLLGGALVSLLLLNTVLAQDAFTLSELQRGNQQLSERKQALQEDISRENSPAILHAKARALGMVDGNRPAFIDARTGRVTEGGTRPPGVSDDAMAAAAGAGVTGAPGAIMPPAGGTQHQQHPGNSGTGGGTR